MVFVLIGVGGSCLAEHAVFFEEGRSMQVAGVEVVDDVAYLTLVGGGEIAIPAERIVNWQELSAPEGASVPEVEEPLDGPEGSWRDMAGEYADAIESAASRYSLDPALLVAVAQAESAFNPQAVSSKGARGLLQLMPDTARRFGVDDSFDAGQNIDGGAQYLSWLLDRFDGRTDLALAGYNAGEGAVDRYQGIPPYRETRQYVDRVLAGAAMLARSGR
jgi:soluble lytic murein transglycosylase-like protein